MTTAYKTDGFLTERIARWACGLRYEDLSESAVEHAKRFWLDSLGCALGGSRTEDAEILLEHHRAMNPSGEGPCSVFATGFRTNPVDAAFLNSHMVRAMDYNDIYWKADPAHPSDLICGPLAICELTGGSGRDLILATVILYELQCRFAEAGLPGIREYGWHHATLSGFAAAFGAGRALGLTPEKMANAVGISASRTGTLGAVTAGELTMMKNTVDPWSSRIGVESVMLAHRGFTGPSHIIDGKEGLFHTFGHASSGGEPCGFDETILAEGLPSSPGAPYRIEQCSMKSFPVEALMHAPLSALMSTLSAHQIAPGSIREIRVEVIARAADILGDPTKYRPTTRETADHSLPYAIAVAIADGVVGPDQFIPSRVTDPALIPLMDAVRVIPNEAFESRFPASQPSRVTVVLESGESHSAEVEYPKGDPRNPMTDGEIAAKQRSLGSQVVGEDGCDAIADAVGMMDSLPGVGPLLTAMGARPEGAVSASL